MAQEQKEVVVEIPKKEEEVAKALPPVTFDELFTLPKKGGCEKCFKGSSMGAIALSFLLTTAMQAYNFYYTNISPVIPLTLNGTL